jgi:RNA polymerase sigma-70 factor, ECF subfamily
LALDRDYCSRSPEVVLVGLARKGDRSAFAEIVRRRQAWIRNLMRRCCGDVTLADDLAQQVFLQAWRTIRQLQQSARFGAWLKRLAINLWLQHARRGDPLRQAIEYEDNGAGHGDAVTLAMDLDRALATLSGEQRLCIVLSYHERMTHAEIADFTALPLGTVKSHIRRGTLRLQGILAAYSGAHVEEDSP